MIKKMMSVSALALLLALAPTDAHASMIRSNQAIAWSMLAERGWQSTAQWSCLRKLWTRESGFNHRARNRYSGAYGIPQALPGRKMASAGADWRTNPRTQVRWGLKYIKGRYGTPCGAWTHSRRTGWY